MKKRSAVGKLVWLREIREQAARRKLASANDEERSARGELEGALARVDAQLPLEEMVTPVELHVLQLQGFKLQEIVQAAEALHAERMQRLRDSRDAWRSAAADLDSAENLRERRLAEEAGRVRAAAERAADDLQVTRRGQRR